MPWARKSAAHDAPIEPQPMMEMCWIGSVEGFDIVYIYDENSWRMIEIIE
jgi:hypothetical protein